MKKGILLILCVIFCAEIFAQGNPVVIGSPKAYVRFLGYAKFDSGLIVPLINTTTHIFPSNENTGFLFLNAPDSTPKLRIGGIIRDIQLAPTIHDSVTRLLNSSFTISSTKEAFFSYSIQIDVTVAIGALASSGKVLPQYSTDAGLTWHNLPYVKNAPTISGLITLTISQTYQVSGFVPAGALVRLATTTVGTAPNVSYAIFPGQERY